MAKTTQPAARRRRGRRRPSAGAGGARAKLVVRLGDGEVQLEADLAVVEARYEKALERLVEAWRPAGDQAAKTAGATAPGPTAPGATPPVVAMRMLAPEKVAAVAPPAAPPAGARNDPGFSLDLALVAELYAVNAAQEISLRVLPRGLKERDRNADVLLLLLYGKLALQGRSPCTAPALLRSARHSGLRIDRASRLLARRRRYVETSGRRRGMRYRLTPAGVEYCEGLLRRLAGDAAPPAPRRS